MTAPTGAQVIVVGSGSAGPVIARRLIDAGASVLLLEAGPPDAGRIFELPALFSTQFKSAFDWDLLTEPEPQLERRRLYLPRAGLLAGRAR